MMGNDDEKYDGLMGTGGGPSLFLPWEKEKKDRLEKTLKH